MNTSERTAENAVEFLRDQVIPLVSKFQGAIRSCDAIRITNNNHVEYAIECEFRWQLLRIRDMAAARWGTTEIDQAFRSLGLRPPTSARDRNITESIRVYEVPAELNDNVRQAS